MHRAALICTSSRFTSTFPRSGPIHASGFTTAARMITIPIVFILPHEPGMKSSPHPGLSPSGEGEQRSGRLPATGAVQYPDCSPTAHHPFWGEGKLSRPLTGTANWIIVRGAARPVVAVANRIGHARQFTPTAMCAADGLCGHAMHRALTSPESETTGLEEIGGSTGAESKRSKNLRCLSDGPQGRSEFRRFSRRCCAGSRFLPRLDLLLRESLRSSAPLWIKPKGH
jgi:hypothetical protein